MGVGSAVMWYEMLEVIAFLPCVAMTAWMSQPSSSQERKFSVPLKSLCLLQAVDVVFLHELNSMSEYCKD